MKICPYALQSIIDYVHLSDIEVLFENIEDLSDFLFTVEMADDTGEIKDDLDEKYKPSYAQELYSLSNIIQCRYCACGRYNECCETKEECK